MRMGALLLFAALASGGCKNKNDADAASDPAADKAQQDLISRRDALMSERQKLAQERDKTAAQLEQAKKGGSDTPETQELMKKLADIEAAIQKANADTDKFLQEVPIAPPKPAGGGGDASAEVTRQLAE